MIQTQKAWAKAIAQPGVEFDPTPLPVLEGAIPPGLRGRLYQNGPACLKRGGQQVGHWFDGDGAVLAVHFQESGATAVYRYVRSSGFLAEVEADRYLFGNYGMTAPGPLWQRWGKPLRNAANTAVLALEDQILALWEGGLPHGLHPETLETLGITDLGGLPGSTYSAHPRQDPQTGWIYNFGLEFGLQATLHLYVNDARGKLLKADRFLLEGVPLIHDFVLAGPYLVFCIPPLRLNLLPVALGITSFSDGFQWLPHKGTQILVFDRENLRLVSRSEAAAWYQWHFGNGFVNSDGQIVVDLAAYPDFRINRRLRQVAQGRVTTAAIAQLTRLRIDPQTAQLQETQVLSTQSCEFPTVAPQEMGQTSTRTYLTLHSPDVDPVAELFGAIAVYDHRQEALTIADLGADHYPDAPIYAPDSLDPNQGWIMSIVFDGSGRSSEVWIFAREALGAGPVCRLGLPEVIPLGFHGTWVGVSRI